MFLRLPAIRRPEMAAEDLVAREQAALANQKIDSHEDRCSERWREARDEMKDLRQRIFETRLAMEQGHRRLTGWIIGGQGSVIMLLAGVLLTKSFYHFLLAHSPQPQQRSDHFPRFTQCLSRRPPPRRHP